MLFKEEEMFVVDPNDLGGLVKLMDRHEEYPEVLVGINENGELITIAIFENKVATRTLQANSWVRLNVYWRDGTKEEVFEGRYS